MKYLKHFYDLIINKFTNKKAIRNKSNRQGLGLISSDGLISVQPLGRPLMNIMYIDYTYPAINNNLKLKKRSETIKRIYDSKESKN